MATKKTAVKKSAAKKNVAKKTAAPAEKKYREISRDYIFKYPSMMWVEVDEEIATGARSIKIVRGSPQYSFWESLRIRKPQFWKKIKESIEGKMVDTVGWDRKTLQIDVGQITTEQIAQLQEEISRLKKSARKKTTVKVDNSSANKELLILIGKKEVELSNATAEIKKLKAEADKIKLIELKTKIPKLEKDLRAFEKLINDKTKKEEDYHVFLKDHDWLFGSTYIEVKSKPSPTAKDKPDFLLKRYDGFHDVVEIESANDPLFSSKSNRLKMSTNLKDAVSEIMDYIDAYIQETMKQFYEEQREVYKPKGLIVIGKTKLSEKRELKQLNSFLHDIEVITFNDLVERARKTIEFIKRQK